MKFIQRKYFFSFIVVSTYLILSIINMILGFINKNGYYSSIILFAIYHLTFLLFLFISLITIKKRNKIDFIILIIYGLLFLNLVFIELSTFNNPYLYDNYFTYKGPGIIYYEKYYRIEYEPLETGILYVSHYIIDFTFYISIIALAFLTYCNFKRKEYLK